MKKIYIVTKYVVAHSAQDAVEKEKKQAPDSVGMSEYSLNQWAESLSE